jgi:predicted ATPase
MISNKIIAKESFMELVYLWVDKYKNIDKQGFNFSPRFRCEFKDGILNIDENKHYVSIFPDNINITAIVGENGSGKSSILFSILEEYSFHEKFLIYSSNNKIFIKLIGFNNKSLIDEISMGKNKLSEIRQRNKNEKEMLNPDIRLYDASLSYKVDDKNCYPNKNFDIKYIEKENIQNIIYYLMDNQHKEYFGNYFEPIKIILKINKSLQDINKQNVEEIEKNLNNKMEKFLFIICKYLCTLIKYFSNMSSDFIELDNVSNFQEFYEIVTKKLLSMKEKDIPARFPHIYPKELEKAKNIVKYLERVSKLSEIFEEFEESDFIGINQFYIESKYLINDNFYIIEELPPCFYIDFQDKENRRYNDLSFGEKESLNIRFYIENIMKKEKEKRIFLLDEPINNFHPDWQKKLLLYLINTFKNREGNIHFILTSHSPFLLSDLPKQNVIFLEKDEKTGNCMNATDKVDINPFGANIHTLLSHGFFMKDGLMGEFAKSKIDLAIKYLNQKVLTPIELDYCENIISIIGEPIIKRELQKMLDSKKLSEIEQIKKEIKALEERMTLIWKNSK